MKAFWDRLGKSDVLALCVMVGTVVAIVAWSAGHTPDYKRGYQDGFVRGYKMATADRR